MSTCMPSSSQWHSRLFLQTDPAPHSTWIQNNLGKAGGVSTYSHSHLYTGPVYVPIRILFLSLSVFSVFLFLPLSLFMSLFYFPFCCLLIAVPLPVHMSLLFPGTLSLFFLFLPVFTPLYLYLSHSPFTCSFLLFCPFPFVCPFSPTSCAVPFPFFSVGSSLFL